MLGQRAGREREGGYSKIKRERETRAVSSEEFLSILLIEWYQLHNNGENEIPWVIF